MAAILIRPSHTERSRLRLFVVQALVLALFVTLFARLWYVQIFSGHGYQAQAAAQSRRELVIQPARGMIVDDEGRPLVSNRSSWVVSVDRSMLDKMSGAEQQQVLHRVARTVGARYRNVKAHTVLCGEDGSVPGKCWNGSPYQPVPVAQDVPQGKAVQILEQTERYPSVVVQTEHLRAYPSPFGVNAAHLIGYLSPVTKDELDRARKHHDKSLNATSVVGRAGLEKSYDRYLRGMPGHKTVTVDSMGRVISHAGEVKPHPGDTLVTSIDAKLQGLVERLLKQTMTKARHTYDPVSHRNYRADSGAAIVMNAHNGRIIAMSSLPTYKPKMWVGGISSKQLKRLYSKKANNPLLSRATQGQFAPGSTWKPEMTVGAFNHGMGPNTRLNCSPGLQVGNRWFKNYESESYGYIDFAKALQISCDTFFYRVGLHFWQKFGSNPKNVNAKDPLVAIAKSFGYGRKTGIDLPGEASGRIADRKWKLEYWKAMKPYYCRLDRENKGDAYMRLFSHQFCLGGYAYGPGDAVNYSIGQGDTLVTPLQLARAYSAISNGGTLFEPRVAKAVVSPAGKLIKRIKAPVQGHVKSKKEAFRYVNRALLGTPRTGTLAWKFIGFPLDKVHVRGKTGSAEVYGKQSTSWVATYNKKYVVVMMMSQAGTGSGTVGPAVRKIWEALYGVHGEQVNPKNTIIPDGSPPKRLPTFAPDGSILPPAGQTGTNHPGKGPR
ncbi:MAG: penicillin-binding protein 2 [Marmoricola sp.]